MDRIVVVIEMKCKKCQKWYEGNLYRDLKDSAVPGNNGKCQE